jgi:hypothetical protein
MKATTLLRKQHRKVEGIFDKLENGGNDRSSLLTELANDLAGHMAIEQTIFYPAVRDIDAEMVEQSYEDHAIAEMALKRLLATQPHDPTFDAKVIALRELIEHHVEEEEEELLPDAEEKMTAEDLESLGDEMETAFEEASERGYQALLPEGLTASADSANQGGASSRSASGAKRATERGARQTST